MSHPPGRRRHRSSLRKSASRYPQLRRFFRIVCIVVLSAVPIYAGFTLLHHATGGFQWPLLSPYFWAFWFIVALTLTIARAPTEEHNDDPVSKADFTLGAINVLTAFVALFYSAS
jgi:hypothetical protein